VVAASAAVWLGTQRDMVAPTALPECSRTRTMVRPPLLVLTLERPGDDFRTPIWPGPTLDKARSALAVDQVTRHQALKALHVIGIRGPGFREQISQVHQKRYLLTRTRLIQLGRPDCCGRFEDVALDAGRAEFFAVRVSTGLRSSATRS